MNNFLKMTTSIYLYVCDTFVFVFIGISPVPIYSPNVTDSSLKDGRIQVPQGRPAVWPSEDCHFAFPDASCYVILENIGRI